MKHWFSTFLINLSTQSVRESIWTTQISLWFPFKNPKNFNDYSLQWNLIRTHHHHHQLIITNFFFFFFLLSIALFAMEHYVCITHSMDVRILRCYYHRCVNYFRTLFNWQKSNTLDTDFNQTHLTSSRWKIECCSFFSRIFMFPSLSYICFVVLCQQGTNKETQTLFLKRLTAIKLIEKTTNRNT